MDKISTLPQPILEIILSLLSTEEAARTSILSREWRYKWTTLSKLEFYSFKLHVANTETNKCTYFDYIHRVLLLHQCPIDELYLEICDGCHRFEFDKLMLHLAKNRTVKKLQLLGWDTPHVFEVPISVFSLHNLADLSLTRLDLEDQTIFNDIGSIKSLVLDDVLISKQSLLLLLSSCPSLNSLNLRIGDTSHGERCNTVELFKCLPMIEHLTIESIDLRYWLQLGLVPNELPSVLFHLKYFCLERTSFDDGCCLPFLLVLIKCAPNLEKIKLEISDYDDYDDEEYSVVWEEYLDVWLEHLNELEIAQFRNTMLEMEFIKFILARSPKLKKVRIQSVVYGDEKLKMVEVLLRAPRAPRASPVIIYV